ncbi:response regulator [Nostoc sp. UCD121]|uniref:hybrid sensor histidine kinase/response regulator n=1 Tax=unclassified Nostoc TaxID=2593658 RepID=UPI00162881EC|nr:MULTISPECIES: response regulator [unclassified Nostoc]MBC1222257.1 response regulator [Nostoc sp. UCD120]MBC1279006.1 response regulator [Nostoc sp. UCD121]MBC1296511.1 response regulator [Nostoc sp. UCD122]
MNIDSILSNTQTTEIVRILVVEDEYILAMNLQETLELLGYTVLDIADSAETAIEKTAELLPNLVLMDIQLQGEMDGIHAAELIWNRFQIPIVYITGHSDKSTVDRAKLTFAFGYILKPIKEQQLYVAIQTALNCYQREQLSQLQRLNQFKEDFLATTSHEMKMPLKNIKMTISVLENILEREGIFNSELLSPFESVAGYLTILRQQCEEGLDLVNNLLSMQMVDTDVYPLELRSFQLQEWLPHLALYFRERARSQQQIFQVSIPQNLPPIVTDLALLSKIVSELLNNACKYSPPDEEIQLTADIIYLKKDFINEDAQSEIEIDSQVPFFEIRISNSGVIIPKKDQSRIFDPFYRIPDNDFWKNGGTGLGLALVKKLVEYLQGTIEFTSTQGWTRFTVILPLSLSK